MTRPVTQKLGIKPQSHGIVLGAPASLAETLGLPAGSTRLAGRFDYIHFFVRDAATLDGKFDDLKRHLGEGGMLWISWPKGGRDTDLDLKRIIAIGYRHGLVESKTISLDAVWSAIKFTFPKEGKVYRNSYGTLPG